MRIVKKTLKGNLLGKTGFKKVGTPSKGRSDGEEGVEAMPPAPPTAGPTVKPRGNASLDTVVPAADDVVIVSEVLHPRHAKAPIVAQGPQRRAPAPSPPPTPRSDEEAQAIREAEADLAATSLGVTASAAGRRGTVAQVRADGTTIPARPRLEPPAPSIAPPLAPPPTNSTPANGATSNAAGAAGAAPKPPLPNGMTLESDAVVLARQVVAEALFRDFGAPGTKMQHPRGASFQVQTRFGEGVVRTQHDLLLPLPAGHVAAHRADVVVELEPQGILVLDIVPSHLPLQEMKARAFDALQMRRLDRCFSVLVFVRSPGSGMSQGQAEAIGHGYDVHFGIDAEHVHSEAKFQALRTRILTWLEAASAANRGH